MADHRGTELLGLMLLVGLALANALNHQVNDRKGIAKTIRVSGFRRNSCFIFTSFFQCCTVRLVKC